MTTEINDDNLHMILYKAKYYNDLQCLIDDYKPDISLFLNSYETIRQYVIKVKTLIKDLLITSNSNIINDMFFLKTYYLFLISFKSYIAANKGKLTTKNSNNPFTIADIETDDNKKNRIFFKIVDYDTQSFQFDNDKCIIDILSAIIFETLFLELRNFKYRHFIPKYKGCFLSYYKRINNNQLFWDYNDIKNINEKYLTLYNDESILNPIKNIKYNTRCAVILYDAINEPISIMDIFKNYNDDKSTENLNLIHKFINNICDIYDFLIYLGIEYGFMHNDLHFGNIIYNPSIDKLMLIDFGRSSFAKYIVNKSKLIDDYLLTEYIKLNLNNFFNNTYYTNIANIKDDTVNKIYHFYYNDDIFWSHISQLINNKFFGIIYDLITISLNTYMRLLYFLKITNYIHIDAFEKYFSLIIKVDYSNNINNLINNIRNFLSTETDLDKLMNNYLKVKTEFVDIINCPKTRRVFKMILEGLSYTAFYFHAINFKYNTIYLANQVLAPRDHLKSLQLFLYKIFKNEKYMNILSSDTFIMYLANIKPTINGGTKKNTNGIYSTFSLYKNIKIKKNRKVSLDKTFDLYNKIQINKTLNSPSKQTLNTSNKVKKERILINES